MTFIQILYLYLLALALAFTEVQIEGEHGWAGKLPCWRPKGWCSKLYARVLGGKEMTGYHLGVFSFAFLIFHLPYVWGLTWNWSTEFITISAFFLFIVVWDFLWFIINPHFGICRFHAGCITWHKIWILGAPVDYYGAVALSFLFYALRVDADSTVSYSQWFMMLGFFAGLLALTIMAVFAVKALHKITKG